MSLKNWNQYLSATNETLKWNFSRNVTNLLTCAYYEGFQSSRFSNMVENNSENTVFFSENLIRISMNNPYLSQTALEIAFQRLQPVILLELSTLSKKLIFLLNLGRKFDIHEYRKLIYQFKWMFIIIYKYNVRINISFILPCTSFKCTATTLSSS